MEPKNLVKENLFSKGELFLDNVEYIGPYNVKERWYLSHIVKIYYWKI